MNDSAELVALASRLVEHARRLGADVAEASASEGWELSTMVRLGEVELLEEAGHRGVSLRVIRDARVATASTSDLTPAGLERCVVDAVGLLELTEPDPEAAPAEPGQLAQPPFADFDLYDVTLEGFEVETAIQLARQAEAVALGLDARVKHSEGAHCGRVLGRSALVLSSGFVGCKQGTYASLSVSPVVEETDGKRRRGSHYTAARFLAELETAESVGRIAAQRALDQIGARSVATTQAPVVFDPAMARSVIGTFAGCLLGGSLYRKSSYLVDREGSVVASPLVTLLDDPTILRGFGSRAYDGEGLPAARRVVVQDGKYLGPLLDLTSARKLGRAPTGSASRGGGSISSSTSNFVLVPGQLSEAELIRSMGTGLYVTELMGFGFNAMTGDYSRGASGFWIEAGERAFPVSGVTISSNLDTMLQQIDAIACEVPRVSSTLSPALRISSMTIAGE